MNESLPFIITISRLFGSGGAYVGKQLARKLNIAYLDRDILSQAAKEFSLPEEALKPYEEKTDSFWDLIQRSLFGNPYVYAPPTIYLPTSRQLYEAESDVIVRAAKERSAVIVGRCASCLLHNRPNHLSVFLYSDVDFRKNRVREIYNLSDSKALKMIAKNDEERTRYHSEFAGDNWTDATRYHLAIDTGKIGVDKCVDLIMDYIELVFNRVPASS